MNNVFPTEPCQLPDTSIISSFISGKVEISALITASEPELQKIIFLKFGKKDFINFENLSACKFGWEKIENFFVNIFKLLTKTWLLWPNNKLPEQWDKSINFFPLKKFYLHLFK